MTRQRRLVFFALTGLLIAVVVEVLSHLAIHRLPGGPFSLQELGEGIPGPEEREGAALPGQRQWSREAIHPYLGFVLDSRFQPKLRRAAGGREALDYGFFLVEEGAFHRPTEGTLVVALTGGSLTFNLARRSADLVRRELVQAHPEVDRVVLVNFALPGYKQPQQLFVLNYFLSLGAHFDIVINLDGFNEVALPPGENIRKGIAGFYPRSWFFRVNKDYDPEIKTRLEERSFLKREIERQETRFEDSSLRYSRFATLFHTLRQRRLSGEVQRHERELLDLQSAWPNQYAVTGPTTEYADPEAMYSSLVDLWARTSLLMHQLCEANEIPYFHFLQPNQYNPGSNPIGPVVSDNHPYGKHARAAYPMLIKRGAELRSAGVRYSDLTAVFADVTEQIYIDQCCHVGRKGDERIAVAMTRAVVRDR